MGAVLRVTGKFLKRHDLVILQELERVRRRKSRRRYR